MQSKLETFLKEQKIDPRRVTVASRQIERLRPEDRAIRLALHQSRKSEDAKRPEVSKPRSGRVVSKTTLARAFAGKKVSGPTKTRILRAVNRILEQRKGKPVSLGELFD